MDKIIRVRDLSFEYEPGLKTIDHIIIAIGALSPLRL